MRKLSIVTFSLSFFFFSSFVYAEELGLSLDSNYKTDSNTLTSTGSIQVVRTDQAQSGFETDLAMELELAFNNSEILTLSPRINSFNYQFTGELGDVLAKLRLGRDKSLDVTGLFVPAVYDGLSLSFESAHTVVQLGAGYEGFSFASMDRSLRNANLAYLSGQSFIMAPTAANIDSFNATLNPSDLFVYGNFILPELFSRQSIFLSTSYQARLAQIIDYQQSGDALQAFSAIAGLTGPLDLRSFYAVFAGMSALAPTIAADASFGWNVGLDLRTYFEGKGAPRLGLQAIYSSKNAFLPLPLNVIDQKLPILESNALLGLLNLEGILVSHDDYSRLGLDWSLTGFLAIKPELGAGLVAAASFDTFSGLALGGAQLGLTWKLSRDVMLDTSVLFLTSDTSLSGTIEAAGFDQVSAQFGLKFAW